MQGHLRDLGHLRRAFDKQDADVFQLVGQGIVSFYVIECRVLSKPQLSCARSKYQAKSFFSRFAVLRMSC
jgi:hypothetical protein